MRAYQRWLLALVVVGLLGGLLSASLATAGGIATDKPQPAQPAHDYVLIKLADPPIASYEGGIQDIPRTKPLPGQKLDLTSDAARQYGNYLASKRQNYKDFLQGKAPRAQVIREYSVVFNGLAVKLNGELPATLAQGPGVAAVVPSFLVRPLMNISPGLIGAPDAWKAVGGTNKAGAGIKIAIVDTGIDQTHPFLTDKTLKPPEGYPKGDTRFTSNKVIVARVYCSGCPDATPGDMWSNHGTHVAGTAAGVHGATATVSGVTIRGLSGIAPKAFLGNYNVFPSKGAGFIAFGGSAFSHDIIKALEDAVADGMDVVNMSLGGGVQGPHDLLAEATNATVDAGLIVAVAAGNSGPGDATVESPGSAEKALTAGASTNPHFVGQPVTVQDVGTYGGAVGDFAAFQTVKYPYDFWGNLTSDTSGQACSAVSGTPFAGKIAVIRRGACTFTTKIRNAQNAGAIGVVVVNNVAGDPVAMGHDGTTPKPTIPAVMVEKNGGERFISKAPSYMSISATFKEFITTNADIIAGFSSRGPTPFTFLIKPDVTAPGVNVLSSVFNEEVYLTTRQTTEDWAFYQGTSMATPHLAGASAVLLQFFRERLRTSSPIPYPDIVKSAIVNTAKRPVFDHRKGTDPTGVLTRGGGRVDLAAAVDTQGVFAPASVSFGFHRGSAPISVFRTIIIVNVTKYTRTYSIAIDQHNPIPGLTVGLDKGTITLGQGDKATFTVSLSAATTVPSGDYEGDIVVTSANREMRIPYWVRIDRGGP